MDDIEKTIEGLEDFIESYKAAFDDGGYAPVEDALNLLKAQKEKDELQKEEMSGVDAAFDKIISDMKEMLKKTEPRVMTLEEVKALPAESDVWVEITGAKGSKPRITATTIHGNGEKEIFGWLHTFNFAAYGKEIYGWRCWTSRPTDEQREAVKWDETKY